MSMAQMRSIRPLRAYTEETVYRRLCQILGLDNHVGEMIDYGCLEGFRMLGTGNNWMIRKEENRTYTLWSRHGFCDDFDSVVNWLI